VSVRVVPVMELGESGAAKGETGNRSKAGGFAGLQHSQGLGWVHHTLWLLGENEQTCMGLAMREAKQGP